MSKRPNACPKVAGDPVGGDTSNTPPQTSHHSYNDIPAMPGSEDWLEWSWSIDWGSNWVKLRRTLDQLKRRAAENNGRPEDGRTDTIDLLGTPAIVSPGGARLGKGIKGPFMPWRFTWQGMVFLVADQAEQHRTRPSVVVRADGSSCLAERAEVLWDRAGTLIASLGGDIVKERLTRVDPCLDIPGQSIVPFLEAYREGRYITRAKDHCVNQGNRGTTIYIGASPKLRIYDKLAEVMNRGGGVKLAQMVFQRWGRQTPKAAIRVEFEIGRKPLTDRGIDSVRDYFDRRQDLVHYFTHDWVRFTDQVPDRTHTSRARLMPLWVQVQDGFQAWTGRPVGLPLEPLPKETVDVSMLIKSAAGLLMSAAARQGQAVQHADDLLRYGVPQLNRVLRDLDIAERMRQKAAEHADANLGSAGSDGMLK